ncbi:hypothetical protein ACQ33O_02810 [Ferruginibacter sp. SUN002]|uniref:hypothetical protein n=1 Tax=Ferruginibacter sp. SUN002 TaxID=2937789 RepID=UPI003D36B707
MKYVLREHNKIEIGNNLLQFPNETRIGKVELFKNSICFNTTPVEKDLDWSKIETHQIWKERCLNNPSELFCYGFSGKLEWQFQYNNIVGFGKITSDLQKEENIGKELLEVYAGDFRYVLDVSSGEILGESYHK